MLFICILLLLLSAAAVAMENTGAADIVLKGGERGEVPFPHHRHQTVLKDCNTCHIIFPQKLGGIGELIEKKDLEKKQVMKDHCIKCHRERKKAGENTGPISCAKCHIK
jgi:cytochrome c-type protein NrfB